MQANEIIQNCKESLKKHYGHRFTGLILYGSLARKEGTQESDIDLLVLLKGSFDYFQEIEIIIDLLYPLQLESERLISAKPVSIDDYESGRLSFYRNAKKEGMLV
jgi:predicted nucleotidyltransferase